MEGDDGGDGGSQTKRQKTQDPPELKPESEPQPQFVAPAAPLLPLERHPSLQDTLPTAAAAFSQEASRPSEPQAETAPTRTLSDFLSQLGPSGAAGRDLPPKEDPREAEVQKAIGFARNLINLLTEFLNKNTAEPARMEAWSRALDVFKQRLVPPTTVISVVGDTGGKKFSFFFFLSEPGQQPS